MFCNAFFFFFWLLFYLAYFFPLIIFQNVEFILQDFKKRIDNIYNIEKLKIPLKYCVDFKVWFKF
jgi:hypothetical protein